MRKILVEVKREQVDLAAEQVSGGILWANLHLLFWLSLFPFATAWMGENHLAAVPTAVCGCVLLMAAIAYVVLQRAVLAKEGRESLLAVTIAKDWKGKLSLPRSTSLRSRSRLSALDRRRMLCVGRVLVVDSRSSNREGFKESPVATRECAPCPAVGAAFLPNLRCD